MAPADPRKKVLFDDSDDESDGGVHLKINDEFAKRFEHNKKREERHRCESNHCRSSLFSLLTCTSGGEVQVKASKWQ